MLTCKNKIFNKFLFFSLVFLIVSFAVNSVIVYALEPVEKKRHLHNKVKAAEIQIQQREILDHLERIENKMIISEKRRRYVN